MFRALSNSVFRKTANPTPARGRWLKRVVVAVAFAYPLLLLAAVMGLALVGERTGLTAAGLYAPRVLFVVPLPFIVVALLWAGARRFWWTQLIALGLVLFPLLGIVLPRWPRAQPSGPRLRVLSLNADSVSAGVPAVVSAVLEAAPDVVLIQETYSNRSALASGLGAHFPHVRASTEFVVASRYPIASAAPLTVVASDPRHPVPTAYRCLIETPLGSLVIYDMHPISPRGMLHVYRFADLLPELGSGRLWSKNPDFDPGGNTQLRVAELEAIAHAAASETVPLVIAGDSNSPGLSPALRRALSGYLDGFSAVGSGLGYTYPAKRPFLRLDRIFVGQSLGFASFHVGCAGASDHLCVWADIVRR